MPHALKPGDWVLHAGEGDARAWEVFSGSSGGLRTRVAGCDREGVAIDYSTPDESFLIFASRAELKAYVALVGARLRDPLD